MDSVGSGFQASAADVVKSFRTDRMKLYAWLLTLPLLFLLGFLGILAPISAGKEGRTFLEPSLLFSLLAASLLFYGGGLCFAWSHSARDARSSIHLCRDRLKNCRVQLRGIWYDLELKRDRREQVHEQNIRHYHRIARHCEIVLEEQENHLREHLGLKRR